MIIEKASDLKNYLAENEAIGFLLRNKKAALAFLIIFLGLIAGLYLVKNPQILKSRAADEVTKINTKDVSQDVNYPTEIKTTTPHLQITVDPDDLPK